MKDMTKEFFEYVECMIDGRGVYPHPAFARMLDGTIEVAALALGPQDVFRWFWDKVSVEGAAECMFGLDRTTKEGQGTEFADVLTCCYWKDGLDGRTWDKSFRIAVINYQPEPRIVRPLDWDNEFWKQRLAAELASYAPLARLVVRKRKPDEAGRWRN